MTLRGWLALLAIYVGYLFLGAFLFNAIECPRELAELEKLEKEDLHLTNKIRSMWKGLEEQNQKVCAFFVQQHHVILRSWKKSLATGSTAGSSCGTPLKETNLPWSQM